MIICHCILYLDKKEEEVALEIDLWVAEAFPEEEEVALAVLLLHDLGYLYIECDLYILLLACILFCPLHVCIYCYFYYLS